jgi:hypothetical protein
MRRRVFLLLMIVLLLTGSATGVHASTDCQRWFIAYKNELAHSQAAKRLHAAKLRARRYAQMKLAGYIKPKPVPKPRHSYPRRPRMTRAEMLRRFNLACGVLPEREADPLTISEETPADFSSQHSFGDRVEPLPVADDEQLATVPPPQYPNYPTDNPMPPIGGFPGTPGGGGFPPSGPPPSQPPVTPVPEPESLVLLLTGIIGGAGVIRRKIKAARA